MSCEVQVLKGTTAMWAVNDSIIPLGVFCIEILNNDSVKVKVGDNLHKFSELDYLVTSTNTSLVVSWRPNTPYIINTMVVHGGELYIAKTNVEPNPLFIHADWKAVTDAAVAVEIDSKLNKNAINYSLITNIVPQVSETEVSFDLANYNPVTESHTVSKVSIPLADNVNSGIMPASTFRAITEYGTRLAALEGRISVFLADFTTFADEDNPTDAELFNAYRSAVSDDEAELFDGITIVNDANTSISYRYYASIDGWKRNTDSEISIATNDTLGVVASSNEDGKVFVEQDGTMSLNGYDDIVEGKKYPSAAIRAKEEGEQGEEVESTKLVEAAIETDNYNGYQEDKQILHLKVKDGNQLADAQGLKVNGVRIDFDHDSLIIKTGTEEQVYHLQKGPYKVTSPNATVEMYGDLFIFDENTPGKGIIRRGFDGAIIEVTDLGIYAPKSSINVIHIYDADDNDVCYILNEIDQSTTLVVYPHELPQFIEYKTCDFGSPSRTPQNISDIEILTTAQTDSAEDMRHSLFMRNGHNFQSGANATISEYILFQLEDCSFRVLNSSTKSCTNNATGFNPALNFGDDRFIWEAHTDKADYESEAEDVIDTSYAEWRVGNRRLPYRTGAWHTESGSVRMNKRQRGTHNGVYNFSKGAQILWGGWDTTDRQCILITPGGFIGWFTINDSLQYWYYKDWREIEIKNENSPYNGRRGILLYSINGGTTTVFIVTDDDDPDKTVCVYLNTNTNNLHHKSGLNPIAANFNCVPACPFNDGIHVFLDGHDMADAAERYTAYINLSEIAPNTYDAETNTWTQHFDCHCLDTYKDTGVTTLYWRSGNWSMMDDFEFAGNEEDGVHGTLVMGYRNVDLFIPRVEDTWNGETGVRPYFIRRPSDVGASFNNYTTTNAHWLKDMNCAVFWNNHVIRGLGTNTDLKVDTTFALDYYWDSDAKRVKCKSIPFATGRVMCPIILDDKHLILWPTNGANRCVVLTWNNQTEDYTIIDGGAWLPGRSTTGHIVYLKDDGFANTPDNKNKLYIFDATVARTDYLRLTYTEDEEGNSIPEWRTFPLPKSMTCGRIIAYPDDERFVLFENVASGNAYYCTLESGSIALSIPDSVRIENIFDITNRFNPDENTTDHAYALFGDGNYAFFYVMERDPNTRLPIITRFTKRAGVTRRIWALPPKEEEIGHYVNPNYYIVDYIKKTLRFAVGSNCCTASVASTPVVIIERLGGTISEDSPNPASFTQVRDFGTDASAAARADLPVRAAIWCEPVLLSDNQTVLFKAQKTKHYGDAYSQNQDCMLLGYNERGEAVYGERDFPNSAISSYYGDIANTDLDFFEIGLDKDRDSYIRTSTDFGYALRIAEDWEAFEQDTEYTSGCVFKGGSCCNVWLAGQETDNYRGRPLTQLLVEGEIVSSNINGHRAGQHTHMASFGTRTAALWGGSATNFGPQNAKGFAQQFKIKKHRIFMRDLCRATDVANWSINEPPTVMDMTYGVPFAALAADNYTGANGSSRVPVFEVTARTPMYDLYTHQIRPGFFIKRNNQVVPQFANANDGNIIPFFQFTNEKCSMLCRTAGNTNMEGYRPFFGQEQFTKGREVTATGINDLYITRELYDSENGDTEVMCFYYDEAFGDWRYKEIKIPGADEFIKQIIHSANKMVLYGPTKKWEIDLLNDRAVTLTDEPPYSLALCAFDCNADVYSIIEEDKYNLHKYLPQSLVMEYQGKEYWTIPMRDLILRGQTVSEYMTVMRDLRANTLEATTIVLQSKYPKVTY